MPKFFTNLSDSLDAFNPEIPEEWYGEETFDEEGLRHSFNDLPMVFRTWHGAETHGSALEENVIQEFRWYSHGKLYRAAGKPVIVMIAGRTYSTLDETKRSHSYNGQPSQFFFSNTEKTLIVSWHKNGIIHRKGDLPASIYFNVDGKITCKYYSLNGLQHRGNSLPCEETIDNKAWMVNGVLHNTTGPADISTGLNGYVYALYGIEVPPKLFKKIIKLNEEWDAPLWVVFLLMLKVINYEQTTIFEDKNGSWNPQIPMSWILHAWNLTASSFEEKIEECGEQNLKIAFYSYPTAITHFQDFLNIIEFEEKDALNEAVEKKTAIDA